MQTYSISTGRSRQETQWQNKTVTWEKLVNRLSKVRKTAETVTEYKAMSKADRGRVKDIGGFVGGSINGGNRKAGAILDRSMVTLDIDYGQTDTPDVIDDLLYGFAWCLYSTHSHTPETPRYRLVIPLTRNVTPDEYIPIARRLAEEIGIDLFDSSTYEPSRLMYWPSCPKDGEYIFRNCDGEPTDADKVLDTYTDWRNTEEWPMDKRTLRVAKGHGPKQEDPTTKAGLIGAFCRTYSISQAIAAFLPDVYTETAHVGRYTFAGGTTEAGLVVYDDLYAFSHHGTDPCCEKLCNAFDLVRLHKFGQLDAETDSETPVNRLPSFSAMEAFIRKDTKVMGLVKKEALSEINEDFADALAEDQDWASLLQLDKKNKPENSPYNFGVIIRNDPRLKGMVRRDAFRGKNEVTRDLPWRPKSADPYWNNSDNNGLIDYMSQHYKLQGKQAIIDANDLAMSQNSYHPVRDYLDSLTWDGTPRLDALMIDYLGAQDTPLTRAVTRKHFTAAVARIMKPGTKYDYVLTLIGAEGLGKSTLIKKMGAEYFDDSLGTIEGKEGMEQIRGKWLIEMGELTNYKKSTSEAYKAFLSKTEDSYRPAYGRETENIPRQCVFFATTNERNFLKGDTGNRRFWVIECEQDLPEKNVFSDLDAERDQIWAEAVQRYRDGEPLYLPRELEMAARQGQTEHNEVSADDRIGVIEAYLKRRLPEAWDSFTVDMRRKFIQGPELSEGDPFILRDTVSAVEVLAECFGEKLDERTRYRTKEINQILKERLKLQPAGGKRDKAYGKQRVYKVEQ